MAIRLISPLNSFIKFGESSLITSCNYRDIDLCLPVYEEDDVHFQFVAETDTVEEADALCDLTNELVEVGLAGGCDEGFAVVFTEKPDRYRISDFQILYNWSHGLPSFSTYFEVGKCFVIKVDVNGFERCSNCLQRIGNDCHTSVIEYGNDDNAFGFVYCSSGSIGETDSETCDPTFVSFTNQSLLTIPYTAGMVAKYGLVPTIKSWLYDVNGELVNMSVRQAFDGYPPTEIRIDLGGNSSGILKIS